VKGTFHYSELVPPVKRGESGPFNEKSETDSKKKGDCRKKARRTKQKEGKDEKRDEEEKGGSTKSRRGSQKLSHLNWNKYCLRNSNKETDKKEEKLGEVSKGEGGENPRKPRKCQSNFRKEARTTLGHHPKGEELRLEKKNEKFEPSCNEGADDLQRMGIRLPPQKTWK